MISDAQQTCQLKSLSTRGPQGAIYAAAPVACIQYKAHMHARLHLHYTLGPC